MNPLDWLLITLLAYSTIRAAFRGFAREAFALAGLLVGFVAACWGYQALALKLKGLINAAPIAQLAAFFVILAGVMIVATLLGHLVRRTASAVGLGFFDRLGGAAFGLVRGAVFGGAFLLAITAFLPVAPWIQNSSLAPYFLRAAHAVSFTMPADLAARLRHGLEEIKHTNADWIKLGSSSHTGISTH
ncbi:CvpA family protein [Granulicella cerasi]|uniref:CvpA family protein n=1 Tax=Granulicella cerasi TaxID=741063 RepID=A0ABW1ZBP0_9BACT|nr:CvpA family protein [Granulicella cerasi]